MFGGVRMLRSTTTTSRLAAVSLGQSMVNLAPRTSIRCMALGRPSGRGRAKKRSKADAMAELKQYREEATRRRQEQKGDENKEEHENEPENENEKGNENKKEEKKKDQFNFDANQMRKIEFTITRQNILIGLGTAVAVYFFLSGDSDYMSREITWQDFKTQYLDRGQVSKLVVVNNRLVKVQTTGVGNEGVYFTIGSVETFERHMREAQDAAGIASKDRIPVAYESQGKYSRIFMGYIPSVVTFAAIIWILRKSAAGSGGPGGLFSFGKNQARLFNKMTDVKVKFDEVAGMDEAKEEIMEFVKFLKDPQKYKELGARIPRGAILSGSPGTGKTLLAKATAGESGVPFYSISASEFIEMYAGVGASRVRALFKEAREHAPSIVFLDEIDAIGKARGKSPMGGGGTDEREGTLNQLLVEMDGFDSSDHVVVLAGTNRPDVLDPALLRPGRFDRRITIDRPDLEGRKAIYDVHLKKIVLEDPIEKLDGRLAAMTPGFAGADIANVCNEAALIAARMGDDKVRVLHFEKAIDRVIAGLERKTRVLTPEKKRVVAYHEAGHAVCGWFLEHSDPLVKVSIIPRASAALGYAQYVPPEHYLYTKNQFMDRITMALGGRVSEELNFDSVTLGASDDFKKVTQMARNMVTKYGMSSTVGSVYFDREPMQPQEPFSQDTGRLIDAEVRRIVNEGHERCVQLLTEKKEQVELVAEELLKKEVIGRDDLIRILGPRPFKENSAAFDKYLSPGNETTSL